MSSRTDSPRGSSVRRRDPEPPSAEDALSDPAPPTDDTPTIISRGPAPGAITDLESTRSIRGRRLAHFELIEPIGVGGMAAVIRARDTQLDRFVALKILPPEMAIDPENIRRFHQEARSAAKLDHENIARVFFCGEDQRLHFIAFEFVEGDNLRTVIERRGRLPVGEALHYMIQVAAGLAHASQRGVVHRDIKPSNIIITPTGRAKLVDMGLARSLSPRGGDDLTQSGVTLGTFDYISPEQALEPRDADARSDIYSLGCTFYHALTGRPPVPDGTAAKKLHHHHHVKPVDPRDVVPTLPLEVVQVIDRMIAKKPSDRFASGELLVQALLTAARHVGAGANVPEGMMSVETPLPPRPTGWPLLLMAVLGLGLVIGLVVLLDPTASHPPTPRSSHPPRPAPTPVVAGPKDSPAARTDEDKGDKEDELKHRVIEVRAETTLAELTKRLAACRDVEHVEVVFLHGLPVSPRSGDEGRPRTGPPLLVQAKGKVTIRAGHGVGRPEIRLGYNATPVDGSLTALTIRAPESDVSGLRIVIDAADSDAQMRGLHLAGGGKHTVRGCLFVQARPSADTVSVQASTERDSDEVTLRECVFLGYVRGLGDESRPYAGADVGGQVAVSCSGRGTLKVDNCAVGPHLTAFKADATARIDVGQSTVLLPAKPSAAFETAGGPLTANHCLVARLPGDAEAGAVLVRQKGEGKFFRGTDNAYYDLDGYLAHGNDWQSAGWGAFRKAGSGARDSRRALSSPWQRTTEGLIADLDSQQPESAFKIVLNDPALRTEVGIVGVENVLGTPWLTGELPPLNEAADVSRRVLTVEPGADDAENGVYKSLELAVANVNPGDSIVIRHAGRLDIESPMVLNAKKLADLKVKAARKFRPELVFRAASETDSALFRVIDHKLTLEGLDVTLHPAEPADASEVRPASHALAALVGDGEVVLRGCTVTLVRSDVPVYLATMGDASKLMRLPGMPTVQRDRGPLLKLDGCVVRGEGDLLFGRAARPMKLDLKNTVVALGGSLLRLEHAGGGDGAMPAAAHKVAVELKQVTAYLSGPALRLKAEKDPAGMVPVEVRAESSLFLPANGAKNLIVLEGPEGAEKPFEGKWSWGGTGKNAYGKYTSMVGQEGGTEMAGMMSASSWQKMTGDDAATINVVPVKVPAGELRLMVPADLVGPAGVGAKLP